MVGLLGKGITWYGFSGGNEQNLGSALKFYPWREDSQNFEFEKIGAISFTVRVRIGIRSTTV